MSTLFGKTVRRISVSLVDHRGDYAVVEATDITTGIQVAGPVSIPWVETMKELKNRLCASMNEAARSPIRIVDADGDPVQDMPWRQTVRVSTLFSWARR